jgi:hypothetical protein
MSQPHPILEKLTNAERARDAMIAQAAADYEARVEEIVAAYFDEVARLRGDVAPPAEPAATTPTTVAPAETRPTTKRKTPPTETPPVQNPPAQTAPASPSGDFF